MAPSRAGRRQTIQEKSCPQDSATRNCSVRACAAVRAGPVGVGLWRGAGVWGDERGIVGTATGRYHPVPVLSPPCVLSSLLPVSCPISSLCPVLSPPCVLSSLLPVSCPLFSLCPVLSLPCVLSSLLSVSCPLSSLCPVPSPPCVLSSLLPVSCPLSSLCSVLSPPCVLSSLLPVHPNASGPLKKLGQILRRGAQIEPYRFCYSFNGLLLTTVIHLRSNKACRKQFGGPFLIFVSIFLSF